MTEQLINPHPTSATPESLHRLDQEVRQHVLEQMLGSDFDYAREHGLIDLFAYDPVKEQDGILHVLAGAVETDTDGNKIRSGLHSEAGASRVWNPREASDEAGHRTYVDTGYVDRLKDELEKTTGKRRDSIKSTIRQFTPEPFEPHAARVVIDDEYKGKFVRNENGEYERKIVDSVMFPREYDVLMVLKSIAEAYNTRDPQSDTPNDAGYEVNDTGLALMLDGKHSMRVRLVLDPETKKIVTAHPLDRKPVMKLSPEDVQLHLDLTDKPTSLIRSAGGIVIDLTEPAVDLTEKTARHL